MDRVTSGVGYQSGVVMKCILKPPTHPSARQRGYTFLFPRDTVLMCSRKCYPADHTKSVGCPEVYQVCPNSAQSPSLPPIYVPTRRSHYLRHQQPSQDT
ncbi:hypothetical protein Pmani_035298 [Petrolisthes manimaculis]|uniref:Uncharacterized protein n=1 Tax=Petrolisthes manimaculis TaxID=1843537 RepID=A0AAE1NLY5_9EUCA|nr:hypothetical protein Pmani_035298 [Petrolisthes manimaculis]